MSAVTFDSTVAARTRCAEHILGTPDLLTLYTGLGGLDSDLESIRDPGKEAEALSQSRSAAKAVGGAATLDVLTSFTALQTEYKAVMAVVQAVEGDLESAGAAPELIAQVQQILVNEAEVTVVSVPVADAADKAGGAKPKKRVVKRVTQEAMRAEINRDACALLGLKPAQKALAARKVSVKRLEALRDASAALSGKLSDRATKKGAAQAATTELRDAVTRQRRAWSACYRLLAMAGRADARVQMLLHEASRKPSAK